MSRRKDGTMPSPPKLFDDEGLYRWLVEVAERGEKMPTNPEINERFLGQRLNGGSAGNALSRLTLAKRIRFVQRNHGRVIQIIATGKMTGGELRRQEAVTDPRSVEAIVERFRAGYSTGAIGRQCGLTAGEVLAIISENWERLKAGPSHDGHGRWPTAGMQVQPIAHRLLGPIGPARSCRWIEGQDYLARAWHGDEALYCGDPTVRGSSYCEVHHRRCWTPVKRTRKVQPGEVDYRMTSRPTGSR